MKLILKECKEVKNQTRTMLQRWLEISEAPVECIWPGEVKQVITTILTETQLVEMSSSSSGVATHS